MQEHIPADVTIRFVPLDEYVASSLMNPFILAQIRIGVYNLENIYEDFLSFARSYTPERRLEVCYDLIRNQTDGVDEELAESVVMWAAAHEAHHFHAHNDGASLNVLKQAHKEKECNAHVASQFPGLKTRLEEFERESPVYRRVYARVRAIEEGLVA